MTIATNQNKLDNYIPPDGGWGWVVVFASFAIHFIMDGITYSLGTYLTAFTENFNVSHGEASIVHSLLPAITLSTGPLASWFTNKYGCRYTTLIGSLIASFGFFLSFFVNKFYYLYITIGCIVGVGFGLIYVPAIVSVGYYFEKKRSLAIGIAVCGAGVGTFVLSPFNRILENTYGLKGAFLVKSAICLNMCVCGFLIRPVPVEPSELKKLMKKRHRTNSHIPNTAHHNLTPVLESPSNDMQISNEINNIEHESMSELNTSGAIAITVTGSNAKNGKIGDSLPAIYMKSPYNTSSLKINSTKSGNEEKQFLNVESSNANEIAKSMPMLSMNNAQQFLKENDTEANLLNSKPKVKSMNSAMDIMAHIRSLQSIPIYNFNENEDNVSKKSTDYDSIERLGWFKTKLNKLKGELDLSLFKDPVFIFFAISNFLTSLGFNTPFIYIVDQATLLNIETQKADLLLSTIGISNTIGRVVLGIISDMKNVNRLYLYSSLITICGISTSIEPFCTGFAGLFIYAIIFGITSGGYVSLTSVLLVDLLGLDKLTNAFGILLVFQGIATSIGPPSVGILFDIFHSYIIPFVITGILIAISGSMCFFIPCIKSPNKK